MYLFIDDMIVYVENSKKSIKKLLDLLSELNEVKIYHINIQTCIAFLCNSNWEIIFQKNKIQTKYANQLCFYRAAIRNEI